MVKLAIDAELFGSLVGKSAILVARLMVHFFAMRHMHICLTLN